MSEIYTFLRLIFIYLNINKDFKLQLLLTLTNLNLDGLWIFAFTHRSIAVQLKPTNAEAVACCLELSWKETRAEIELYNGGGDQPHRLLPTTSFPHSFFYRWTQPHPSPASNQLEWCNTILISRFVSFRLTLKPFLIHPTTTTARLSHIHTEPVIGSVSYSVI